MNRLNSNWLLASLKGHVLLSIITAIVILIGFSIAQWFVGSRMTNLQIQSSSLYQAKSELLKIRSHENAYLANFNKSDLVVADSYRSLFKSRLDTINNLLFPSEVNSDVIHEVVDAFERYEMAFVNYIRVVERVNVVDPNTLIKVHYNPAIKLIKKMQSHELVALSSMFNRVLLIDARLVYLPSDPLLLRHLKLMGEFKDELNLLPLTDVKVELLVLLSQYELAVNVYQQELALMGYNDDSGLRGEFNKAAKHVEKKLSYLHSQFLPIIISSKSEMRTINILFLVLAPLLIIATMLIMMKRVKRSMKVLIDYVDSSHDTFHKINMGDLIFSEFKFLARRVMTMLVAHYESDEKVKSQLTQIKMLNSQLGDVANTDPLTMIANRRQFDTWFDQSFRSAVRHQTSLAVILIDVDYFKRYNDHYGHKKGDDALVAVASMLEAALPRSIDRVARYGGEEFIMMLPDTDKQGAEKVMERVLSAFEKRRIEHEKSDTAAYLTVSAGIFVSVPLSSSRPEDWYGLADKGLYKSKRNGRNQFKTLCKID